MSKNILGLAILFSLALSMILTQEASALTNWSGQTIGTSARFGLSKVCGYHICEFGGNSRWITAVLASQREGPGKATGGQYGYVIMQQLVVNSLVTANSINSTMNNNVNSTSSK